MYGITESIDLSFMLGHELEQVCIGLHQVILRFSNSLSITIEGLSGLAFPGKGFLKIEAEDHTQTTQLVILLGKKISNVFVNYDEGSVKVIFTGDYSLTLFDSKENYESYAISLNGDKLIV